MFKTCSLIRFASVAVVGVFAAQQSAVADSYFEFYPRTVTVHHEMGRSEFKARIWVTPRIDGEPDRPVIAFSNNRLELIRKDPAGLARVEWEFDLSDCDMRKQFEVEVELTGANGDRTEPVDQNGYFTYYAGDVISAINVDYEWLGNEASWQFTHGRRMPDGVEVPFLPSSSGGTGQPPRVNAELFRKEARQLRELADEIVDMTGQADERVEQLRSQANSLDRAAEAELSAAERE